MPFTSFPKIPNRTRQSTILHIITYSKGIVTVISKNVLDNYQYIYIKFI
jgi:hypothetical protein